MVELVRERERERGWRRGEGGKGGEGGEGERERGWRRGEGERGERGERERGREGERERGREKTEIKNMFSRHWFVMEKHGIIMQQPV